MVGGGGWGDGFERAMEHAEKLGIADRVTKLGWVDDEDLAMLYRQARLFVLASREETFGRCVIESMACGTPCIVNDIPVMHEVTAGHAKIADFSDPDTVVKGIRKLLTDASYFQQLEANGIERAKAFDFDKLAEERVRAIKELISK